MSSLSLPFRVSCRLLTVALASWVSTAGAQTINWVPLQISTLGPDGYSVVFTNLPDGRFILGQQGKVFVQDTFGAAAKTEQAGNSITFDPSFVVARSSTSALLGYGGFAPTSTLHPFDPANPTVTTGGVRPALGPSIQNYVAAYWKSPTTALEGWLIGGTNGTTFKHNITFVSLDGTKTGAITDELCMYSSGMATDAGGNLYAGLFELAGPNQHHSEKVLRYTAAQIEPKIQAIVDGSVPTPLARSAATFVYQFHSASSLAVDGLGRVWASGFGIKPQVYDPVTGAARTVDPTHGQISVSGDPISYNVGSFTRSAVPYVSVLAYDGYTAFASDPSTPVYHIHAPVSEVTMPTDVTYATWTIEEFGTSEFPLATESTSWGAYADPDLDGLTNLVEYALNSDPLVVSSSPITTGTSGGLLTLSFLRHPLRTDIDYRVEVSNSLPGSWTTIAASDNGGVTTAGTASAVNEVTQGALRRVTVTDALTALGQTPRFIRLRVVLNPQ